MKFLTVFLALALNQNGFLRLGGFHRLMDEKDDNEGGGGGGGKKDDQSPGGKDDKKSDNPGGKKDENGDKEKKDNPGDDFDISTLPEAAQSLIKNLRKENAGKRTEFNKLSARLEKFEKGLKTLTGDEDDSEDPEEKLGKVQAVNEGLSMRNALLEMAYENGIAPTERKYFEFLMSEKLESLKEGEELTEDMLAEVVSEVKKAGGGKSANTSTKGDGGSKGNGGKGPNDGDKDGVTLDQFVAMTVTQKSKLYNEKPEIYNTLLAQAKAKKLL